MPALAARSSSLIGLACLGLALAPAAPAQVDLPTEKRSAPPREEPQPREEAQPRQEAEAQARERERPERAAPATRRPAVHRSTKLYDATGRPAGTVTNEVYAGEPEVLGFRPEAPRSRKSGQSSGLDLPSRPRTRPAPPERAPAAEPDAPPAKAEERAAEASPAPAGDAPRSPASGLRLDDLRPAVRVVYDKVRAVQRIDDRLIDEAALALSEAGEDGRLAAHLALGEDHGPLFLMGCRALLKGALPADHDAVVKSLGRRMPGHAAAASVASLVELDPVRATPALLAELLRHPQAGARVAAHKALETRASESLVPLLLPALEDRSADARGRAVSLLARIGGPTASPLLVERISDASPVVARAAVAAVAKAEDASIDRLLLDVAFAEPLPLRRQALAWLALAEREDYQKRAILEPKHAPALLHALNSSQPVVSGCAAIALAGIGFRSPNVEGTRWLDDEVAAQLAAVAAGYQYFDDFEAVRPPALRRLRQISGVDHAGDGSEWARWWLAEGARFKASRAVIAVSPAEETSIRVQVRPGDGTAGFTLLGPDLLASPPAPGTIQGEEYWLDAVQARDLVALFREEGLFGYERLPGVRGAPGIGGRSLDVAAGGASKYFQFGAGHGAPWFERALAATLAAAERNRWQRFPHPDRHRDRRGMFAAERSWWEEDHTSAERDARHEAHLFAYLAAVEPNDRDEALAELERLAERAEVTSREDVVPLLAMLDEEPYFNGRARRIVGLVRDAAGIDAAGGELSTFAASVAGDLVRLLHDRFGADASDEIAALLGARGSDAVGAAAASERGLMRAVAARVLGRELADPRATLSAEGRTARIDQLVAFLDDSDPDVQAAALRALGEARVESARPAIEQRASFGQGGVRAAALRALGALGGSSSIDVLVGALTGDDPRMKVPAAEGLAALRDTSALPVLMSLFRAGRRSEAFDAARAGLVALGPAAVDDLLVAMRAPAPEIRREAALLLGEQLVPQAATTLMRVLAEDPEDRHVARELTVLSCVDHRAAEDPAERWFEWWDQVDRRSPLSWFRAACVARGTTPPPDEAFAGVGTRPAWDFLLAIVVDGDPDWLVERGRRELGRMLGQDVGPLPADAAERAAFAEALELRLMERAASAPSPSPGGDAPAAAPPRD